MPWKPWENRGCSLDGKGIVSGEANSSNAIETLLHKIGYVSFFLRIVPAVPADPPAPSTHPLKTADPAVREAFGTFVLPPLAALVEARLSVLPDSEALRALPPDERNQLGKKYTRRGMALLNLEEAGVLPEALECFERAIRLRTHLPLEEEPWYRWGLTAGWMNRADVLTRQGRLDDALLSYDIALKHLQLLPMDMEVAFSWRLGLAWMSRGLVLQARDGEAGLPEARACLERALTVLTPDVEAGHALHRVTRGCCRVNLAALLLEGEIAQPREAQQAALDALEDLRADEAAEAGAAGAGLKARHRYCQATALLLEAPAVQAAEADAWIMQATDFVEEALLLAERWQGRLDLGDLTLQLFRFGCRIYLAYQPQFLGEFVVDTLERHHAGLTGSDAFHQAGMEALQLAGEVLRQRGPTDLGLTRVDDLLVLLAKLESAARKVRAMGG